MAHRIDPPAVAQDQSPANEFPSCITTIFISNLHCPTCVERIEGLLHGLGLELNDISISIITHSVTIHHDSSTKVTDITEALDRAGFEIHSVFDDDQTTYENVSPEWAQKFEQAISKWRRKWKANCKSSETRQSNNPPTEESAETTESSDMGKKLTHAEHCAQCRAEAAGLSVDGAALPLTTVYPTFSNNTGTSQFTSAEIGVKPATGEDFTLPADVSKSKSFVVVERALDSRPYHADLSISGMTCAACTSAITHAVESKPYVRSININLLQNSAVVVFDGGKEKADEIVETIEDTGFDVTLEHLEQEKPKQVAKTQQQQESDLWRGEWAIGGMTCSACSGSITSALKLNTWIRSVDINLLSNSGTIVFHGKGNADKITGAIEDVGFEATPDSVSAVSDTHVEAVDREVFFKIEGMYCHHCPERIQEALREEYGTDVEVEKEPTNDDPIMKIRYTACAPVFTIRSIFRTINAVDPAFFVSIHHPPTIEDRAKAMHARERGRILRRLALSVTAAVPAFIVGIVCMQLLMKNSAIRMYMMHPIWAGRVSRAEWVLFILATPIYFFAADVFHRRAIHELKALWRPGSPTPIAQRFYRFGSMNMLMSLGTSVAYFSSIAELSIEATQPSMTMIGEDVMPETSNYFDSVIFLTMFLLLGRFIEAYSKAKTGDAVTSLGNLRPSEAILVEEADVVGRKIGVDLLDVGDVVLVQQGASPPFDGLVVDGTSKFDESSLTGESRPVNKEVGDQVFSGTVNKGRPVSIKLTSVAGSSMLDNIIKIVREGQTKRAPIERAADIITSHFVPVVVAIGIMTWVVWLSLGITGALPLNWIEGQTGGWPLWSLRFAIAVFVIACPCGIGLAAPTALFVGGGMAAKHGILVKGGGEAFQEASTLDCIVFDKTGTLTEGGDPAVTDYFLATDDDENEVLGMTKRLEENSSHPVAKALVNFCASKSDQAFIASDTEETPGKGMSGQFRLDEGRTSDDGKNAALDVQVIVGNEALMTDYQVVVDQSCWDTLQSWKQQGKSVVLVALRVADPFADSADSEWKLTAMFAVADALRPEAQGVIEALQSRGVAVWMLSGDNQTTAEAIGAMVGIGKDNIIAGVLPDQKAEKIQYLQKTLPHKESKPRATVAMVGDGINDSPALTMADVGIAIGSGSDVAISSAEFILIKSELASILHLIDLSRVVFRRVWFNFGWALIYNIICLPVAAGIFFPIHDKKGNHVKLDPVWASLAMAMSSISVICSSLLLRANVPYLGFRAVEYGGGKEREESAREEESLSESS